VPLQQRFDSLSSQQHVGDGRFNFATAIAASVERPQLQLEIKKLVTP